MNEQFSIVPFDLKYKDKIDSGEYLVTTRGGNPVRIVCWDKLDSDYPIIGLQRIGNFEFLENYNKEGRVDLLIDNDSDLMVLIDNEPLFVDLGLPSGLKWATRNIDLTQRNGFARSQYQYECSFFSWGNTEGHNPISKNRFDYDWDESSYSNTSGAKLNKSEIIHIINDKWRIPTKYDFQELFDYTNFIKPTGEKIKKRNKNVGIEGVNGILLESKINGARLFFPCSGYGYDTSLHCRGSLGRYWSSSLYPYPSPDSCLGQSLLFSSGGVNPRGRHYRNFGFSVRPVQ